MAGDRNWKGLKAAILQGLRDHEYLEVTVEALLHGIEPEPISDYARAVYRFAGVPEPPSLSDELRAFCAEWDIEVNFSHDPARGRVCFSRGGPGWPAWALAKARRQAGGK